MRNVLLISDSRFVGNSQVKMADGSFVFRICGILDDSLQNFYFINETWGICRIMERLSVPEVLGFWMGDYGGS